MTYILNFRGTFYQSKSLPFSPLPSDAFPLIPLKPCGPLTPAAAATPLSPVAPCGPVAPVPTGVPLYPVGP